MSDTLKVFGTTYSNVAGVKATSTSSEILAYTRGGGGITPSGTMSITSNGTYDVTSYASADVAVPTGADVPTFTVTWDEYYEEIVSVTCDKTYSEIVDNYIYALCYISNGIDNPEGPYPLTYMGGSNGQEIFSFASPDGYYYFDIIYYSNGTITGVFPSAYNLTLNVTSNGEYSPESAGAFTEVNVNVPDSIYTFGLVADSIDNTLFIPDNLSPTTIVTNARATAGNVVISGPNEHVTVQFMSFDDAIPTTVGDDQYYNWITYIVHDAYSVSGKVIESQVIYGLVNNTPKAVKIFQNFYYDTSTGNAVTSQVMAGKVFYNASGASTGTATIRASSDLTVFGSTVTAPAGFYTAAATKSISSGTAATPNTTITANPGISVSTAGLITATVDKSQSITPNITAGYITAGTGGTVTVNGSTTSQLSVQASTTVTPSETVQTAVASGKYTTGDVKVAAIPSTYVGSGVTTRSSSDLTVNAATVTAPAGYYSTVATKAVAAGSVANPTAAKGTVSNHAITVTPSVNSTTGYITGGTKSGTAVTVSASELVSGTLNITSAGTSDVTNYASASVAAGSVGTPTAAKGSVSNHSITVTPSVASTTGFITGGSKSGTGVTVSASELVSGSQTITSNGTVDVTNLASVSVALTFSQITISSSNPSGGNNGDIWIKTS